MSLVFFILDVERDGWSTCSKGQAGHFPGGFRASASFQGRTLTSQIETRNRRIRRAKRPG
jgi:hypothetical protein